MKIISQTRQSIPADSGPSEHGRPHPSLRWSSREGRPKLVSFSWAAVTPTRRQG